MALRKNAALFALCLLLATGCVATQKKTVTSRDTDPFSSSVSSYDEGDISGEAVGPREGMTIAEEDIGLQDYEQTEGVGELSIAEVQGPLPTMSYVNDRIFEYGRKLQRWQQIDEQSAALELNQQDSETMVNCFVDLQNDVATIRCHR